MGICLSKDLKYGISREDKTVYLTPSDLQNGSRYRFEGAADHRQPDPYVYSGSNVTVNPVFINDEPVSDITNQVGATLNDNIEYMVDAFRTVIEGSVKVMDIIPHLLFIGDIDTFRSKDRESSSYAMSFLVDKLKNSDQPGKWQSFIDALTAAEYPYIVRLLKGETDVDHTKTKHILSIFTPRLVDRIEPKHVIDLLYEKEVISKADVEDIQCELTNRGAMAASFLILDKIPRRKENWYNEFVDVLRQCQIDELVDEFHTPPPSVCGRGYLHGSGSGQFMTVPEYGHETTRKIVFNYDHYQSAPPAYDPDVRTCRPRSRSTGGSQKKMLPRRPSQLGLKIDNLEERKISLETELKEKRRLQELKNEITTLKTQLKHIEKDHAATLDEMFGDENTLDAQADTRPSVVFGLDICTNKPMSETIDSNRDETRVNVNNSSAELKNMSSRLDGIMTVVCELQKDMNKFEDILKDAKILKLNIQKKLTDIDTHVKEELKMRVRQPPHPHNAYEEPLYISADSAMYLDDCSYDTKL